MKTKYPKMKVKAECTHCGKKRAYNLTGFENEVTCKYCNKDMSVKFVSDKKALLY